MTIERRIRIAREEAKLSQDELARKIDMTKNSIQRYERDAKGLTVRALIKIAHATKSDSQWIMYGEAKEIKTGVRIAQLIRNIENQDDETIEEIISMTELILMRSQTKRFAV